MYENNNIINEIHEDLFKETEESYDITWIIHGDIESIVSLT